MLRAALTLALAAIPPAFAAEKIVGGPFVVGSGARSATVVWIVEDARVSLGTAPGQADKSAPALRAEKAAFTGLQAGQTYYYDAAGGGRFQAPPNKAAQFEFVVFGDTRTRHDMHKRVVSAILAHAEPSFVVHTGDLVADGSDSAQWPVFFDIERELLRKVVFYPSLGNHERNDRQFYEFFNIGLPYYSFNWGTAHFSIINSDIGNAGATPYAKEAFWAEQTRWLEQDLEKNKNADFRFVAAHHPPFTAVERRQGDNPEMTALVPMLEKYKVTAGFFGHDHNYQHYLKNGIHYVITGGGGAPLYDVAKPPDGITQKVTSTEHFVRIKVDGNRARVEAIGLDGSVIETFGMGQGDTPR